MKFLEGWEFNQHTCCLTGFLNEKKIVTSQVEDFDWEGKVVTTENGSEYYLSGPEVRSNIIEWDVIEAYVENRKIIKERASLMKPILEFMDKNYDEEDARYLMQKLATDDCPTKVLEYLVSLINGEIPNVNPIEALNGVDCMVEYAIRSIQMRMTYSIVNQTAFYKLRSRLKDLVPEGGTILEVCAGNGWWTKGINELTDYEAVATDDQSWSGKSGAGKNKVTEVEDIDALDAISMSEGFDALMVAWPHCNIADPEKGDYDESYDEEVNLTYRIAKAWEAVNPGKPIIYIGEGTHGCCARINFFDVFKQEESVHIPTYSSIHDYISIGHVCDSKGLKDFGADWEDDDEEEEENV